MKHGKHDAEWIVICTTAIAVAGVMTVARFTPRYRDKPVSDFAFDIAAGVLALLIVLGIAVAVWHVITELASAIVRRLRSDTTGRTVRLLNAGSDRGARARAEMMPRLQLIRGIPGSNARIYRDPRTRLYWRIGKRSGFLAHGLDFKCLGDTLDIEIDTPPSRRHDSAA